MSINSAHRTHCRVSVAWLRGRAILLRHMCIAFLVFCSYIAHWQSYPHLYDVCKVQYMSALVKTYEGVGSHSRNHY